MKAKYLKILANTALSLAVMAASAPVYPAMHDEAACVANEDTLSQLKAARSATGAFNSIAAAEAAGYVGPVIPVPNMGVHYVNADLIDDIFEPNRPEALVYADLGHGRLQLVAVEYLAPFSSTPPAGFAGTCDQWSPFGSPPALWTLHAWIWHPNISGTFAKFNPLVP